MDFHTLARRDLQALCKRNKIPANITNVAMADSLKALDFVEGIEELLQTCQSETAQSSIESPMKMEVTSPYVPPTGGRSTRRRTVVKEEPETAKPSARAPRTTRKVQIALDEEKSGVSETPAPSAVTSRRRRGVKEESNVVNQVISTRRSTRLTSKNVQLSNEVGKEKFECSKKELFANDCQESKMSLNDVGPGGVDADINVEVTSEKVEAEVVTAEKQDMSTIEMGEPVEDEVSNQSEAEDLTAEKQDMSTIEKAVSADKQDMSTIEMGEPVEDEVSNQCEAEDFTAEKQDMSTIENEVEAISADKQDMPTIEMGESVEDEVNNQSEADCVELEDTCVVEVNSKEEVDPELISAEEQNMSTIDMGEDEIMNQSEADGAKLEMKGTCDIEIEEVGFGSETESEGEMVEYDETEALNGTLDVKTSEIEVEVVKVEQSQAVNNGENVVLESEDENTYEGAADVISESEASLDVQPSERNMDVEIEEEQSTNNDNGDLESEMDAAGSEDDSEEDSDLESEDDSTGSEVSEDEIEENVSIDVRELNVNEEVVEINGAGSEDEVINSEEDSDLESEDVSSDSEVSEDEIEEDMSIDVTESNMNEEVVKTNANVNEKNDTVVEDEMKDVTPTKASASKASSAKKARTPAVTDNKENNIQSGGKLVKTSKADKLEKKLKDMSVRKLTKLLKEKLNIENKSCQNENDNEAVPAARQALQVLPENRQA